MRELFGFVHRAGTEGSRARVLAELSRFIGEKLAAYRVSVFVIDGEHLVPLVAEYSSGVTDARQIAKWQGGEPLETSELIAKFRAGGDLLLIENPEDVLPTHRVREFEIRPFLMVALRNETTLLGALLVEGDFDDLASRQSEIRSLAGVVALVLETAKTFEGERKRTREIEALLEVGTVLTESTDVTRVLAAVARSSARVCGFERCSILILDDSGRLVPRMSQFADGHTDVELWERFRLMRADLPAARDVMESGAPAAYGEPETAPELNPSVWVSSFDIKSVLLVPLAAWGESFGVLMLDHRERYVIGPEQIRITQAVAAQGAAAIGISRLLEREGENRRKAEAALRDLHLREAQQAAVAAVSQLALTAPNLGALMDEAVRVLAETLDVEFVKVVELQSGGRELFLKAGVGWDEGLVGTITVGIGSDSQAGFTLSASSPVIVADLATETRFSGPGLLTDHNIVSGMSVIIGGREQPYGVLGVHTIRQRTFTSEDIDFIQSVANVLAAAVEQDRDQREVRATHERLQAILDTASDSIIAVGENQKILLFNQHACKTFGYTSEEILGQPLSMLLPEKARPVHSGYIESFADDATPQRMMSGNSELTGRRKDGEEFPVEITISKTTLGDQMILTAIVREVTERKAAEERLIALMQSKDDLIASVSHEIRTPITAILGFAQLLHSESTDFTEAEHADMLQVLINESTDIANIVEDLMVAAKADIGKLEIMRVPVDLRAQAAQVLETWNQTVVGHIQLSGESVRCVGDPARVRQVIRNLVSNALRYGGDNIRVVIGSHESTGFFLLADDGPGVPPDDVKHIFENYERGSQAPGLTEALGLGLGISRRLARLMGGDVTYRHTDGETVFELALPLALPTSAVLNAHGTTASATGVDRGFDAGSKLRFTRRVRDRK
ncbi:MAG: PAS domain S-box protein [Actinomycetota bacterium]|nr:PAS domain S-box protein [Actinomycetota bacterium]